MLGCVLDPLAELDVFVFTSNGDFDAFAPRLARYRKGAEDDTIERRDLLGDLNQVLDDDRVRLTDLPPLLRKLAPAWGPYAALTGIQLRDLLDDAGVRTTNVGNVLRLDPADLRRVLTERGLVRWPVDARDAAGSLTTRAS